MAKWIIVVDDDTAILKMAGHILSKNNMRVTALKSGSSFLEYVTENGTPDLVLLDIKMPVMDGFETLGKLRLQMKMRIQRQGALRSAYPTLSESHSIPMYFSGESITLCPIPRRCRALRAKLLSTS